MYLVFRKLGCWSTEHKASRHAQAIRRNVQICQLVTKNMNSQMNNKKYTESTEKTEEVVVPMQILEQNTDSLPEDVGSSN